MAESDERTNRLAGRLMLPYLIYPCFAVDIKESSCACTCSTNIHVNLTELIEHCGLKANLGIKADNLTNLSVISEYIMLLYCTV